MTEMCIITLPHQYTVSLRLSNESDLQPGQFSRWQIKEIRTLKILPDRTQQTRQMSLDIYTPALAITSVTELCITTCHIQYIE